MVTTQERNTSEEGYVDEHGNVIIEKRTTRTVTTTRTLAEGMSKCKFLLELVKGVDRADHG